MGITTKVLHAVRFLLGLFLLALPISIVLHNVFQVAHNCFATSGLGVIPGNDAGDAFFFVEGI